MKEIFIFSQQDVCLNAVGEKLNILLPEVEAICYSDPIEFLSDLSEGRTANCIMLDVDAQCCNNLRLLKIISSIETMIPVVFLSESGRYAIEAFEWGALDYLKLPLDDERMMSMWEKVKDREDQESNGQIYVQTFGSFKLTIGGKAVPWKNSKTKEMFALLIDARGDSVSSERIQKILWPDMETAKAASNYHTTTFNLRKKLENIGIDHILKGTRGSLKVDMKSIICDLVEFEKYIEDGTKDSYKKAFDLYKGQYLENNSYQWSRFTKVRLDMLFGQVCNNI